MARNQSDNWNQNQRYSQNQNEERGNSGSYGWSNDYRSTQDYRPQQGGFSQDRSSTWTHSDDQRMDRSSTGDTFRGGSFGSSNYGSGSSSFGPSSQSQAQPYSQPYSQSYSQPQGMHSGKGPKNYRRSDDRLRDDVSDALERNAHVDASEIEVEVKDSVVTLRGHVEDRQTKRMAEDLVEGVYGIKDVRNELTVDQSIFTQARNAIFGESVETQSASAQNSNKSTKSKH